MKTDYIVSWTGDGASFQDVRMGFGPRAVTVIGVSGSSGGNIQLSRAGALPNGDCLKLPAGTIVQAIEITQDGLRVSGDANQSGWSYYGFAIS